MAPTFQSLYLSAVCISS